MADNRPPDGGLPLWPGDSGSATLS